MSHKGTNAIASAQLLTSSYVVCTANSSLGTLGENMAMLFITYTTGAAETNNSLTFKVEFSNNESTWFQQSYDAVSGGVNTLTDVEHTFVGASAATDYTKVYGVPVYGKFLRISVKETGVAANFGTVTIACDLDVNISFYNHQLPSVSVSLDEFPAATADSDAFANPTTTDIKAFGHSYNGTTWDRLRGAVNSTDSIGTGIQAVGLIGQFDDVATSAVTENQFANLRIDGTRKLIGAGAYLDDTAFTPAGANSYVIMMGAEADETTTDIVDEGDAGALRMTTDRRLITAGQILDDAVFGVATAYVTPVGYLADETGTDSVDEGDVGIPRMTLNRRPIDAGHFLDDSVFGIATDYVSASGFLADDVGTDLINEGDIGIARITTDRKQIMANNFTDDAPFVVAAEYVGAAGFLADDTATDSVDEGDIGVARMSLDRKQLIAGSYVDDVAFTPAGANSYVVMMGAQADETTPDSVDEGDAGALRMTLTRFLKTSMGDLISGEDQTNTVMQVVEKPLAVSTYTPDLDTSSALEASSVTKASAGVLYGCSFSNTNAATRYLQFFNSSTLPGDATVTVLEFAVAAESTLTVEWAKGRYFSTGIAWCNSSTNGAKTIGAADSLNDVNYK